MQFPKYLAWIGLFCSCSVAVLANTPATTTSAKVFVEGKNASGDRVWSDQPGGYFHWTAEAWTGSEAPFSVIARKIDAQLSKGAKPLKLASFYKVIAQKRPGNAQAQFAWAYSAFMARKKWQQGQDANAIVAGMSDALEQGPSPKSAQYARMRLFFILWENKWNENAPRYLNNCLFRLTKRNPKDFYLKYVFAYKLNEDKQTLPTAMKWAQEYSRQFPKDPKALFLLGRVHDVRFNVYLSASEADRAITYYKKFLALEPNTSPYRNTAEWHIKDIQHWVGVFRSKSWLKS